MLVILAQNETELHIANNSKGIWTGLFTLVLSNTETPFLDRFNLLMHRLQNSTVLNISLILDAIKPVFNGIGSKIVPPKVIGGRIVPEEWRPVNQRELNDLKIVAMKMLISNLYSIKDERKNIIKYFIIDELKMFIEFGTIDTLKDAIKDYMVEEETKFKLRNEIEELIYRYNEYGQYINNVEELKIWLEELSDLSFDGLMKEYLLGDYWSIYHRKGELAINKDIDYLAKEILKNNTSIDSYLELTVIFLFKKL